MVNFYIIPPEMAITPPPDDQCETASTLTTNAPPTTSTTFPSSTLTTNAPPTTFTTFPSSTLTTNTPPTTSTTFPSSTLTTNAPPTTSTSFPSSTTMPLTTLSLSSETTTAPTETAGVVNMQVSETDTTELQTTTVTEILQPFSNASVATNTSQTTLTSLATDNSTSTTHLISTAATTLEIDNTTSQSSSTTSYRTYLSTSTATVTESLNTETSETIKTSAVTYTETITKEFIDTEASTNVTFSTSTTNPVPYSTSGPIEPNVNDTVTITSSTDLSTSSLAPISTTHSTSTNDTSIGNTTETLSSVTLKPTTSAYASSSATYGATLQYDTDTSQSTTIFENLSSTATPPETEPPNTQSINQTVASTPSTLPATSKTAMISETLQQTSIDTENITFATTLTKELSTTQTLPAALVITTSTITRSTALTNTSTSRSSTTMTATVASTALKAKMVFEEGIVMFFLRPFLRLARRLWDFTITLLFLALKGWRRKTPLPPVFNPTLMHSAVDLARYIREGKMNSVEVVRAYITRASDVNPVLNAITQENFKAALLQARRVDEMLNKGLKDGTLTVEMLERRRPFLGVPFTVKETIAVAGFPHTGGLVAREGLLSPSDASVVAKMKKAGAILLGTTNVSELGMWWESDNKVYGRTNNPYDTRRTPGGSSGGEAALMCACGTPLSIGTDSGGSLRIPAFFCGLFSHKPTNGIVSVQGCNIHHHSQYSEVQSAGPISRHARDLSPVLAILAGDRVSQLSLNKRVNPGSLKIYTMENDGDGIWCTRPSPELVAVQRAVAHHFRHTYDITVRKVTIPGMKYSYRIWQEKMNEEFGDDQVMFKQLADNKGEINLWTEIVRSLLGRARHTVPSLAQAALDKLLGEITFLKQQKRVLQGKEDVPLRKAMIKEESLSKALQMRIQRLLGEDGVLLYPSHPTLAPYHSESFYRPFNFVYTAIFNALGFPVTQVPLGLAPNGIPLGIQVVGGIYQDHITIAVAQDLETAFGGWVCPSKIL